MSASSIVLISPGNVACVLREVSHNLLLPLPEHLFVLRLLRQLEMLVEKEQCLAPLPQLHQTRHKDMQHLFLRLAIRLRLAQCGEALLVKNNRLQQVVLASHDRCEVCKPTHFYCCIV